MHSLKIFVVDDDMFSMNIIQQHLINLNYTNLQVYTSGINFLAHIDEQPDVVFLDYEMEFLSGVEILKLIKQFNPDIYVVFISGTEDLDTALDSLKYGAFDYIVKGAKEMLQIKQVLEKISSVRELLKIRDLRCLRTYPRSLGAG